MAADRGGQAEGQKEEKMEYRENVERGIRGRGPAVGKEGYGRRKENN